MKIYYFASQVYPEIDIEESEIFCSSHQSQERLVGLYPRGARFQECLVGLYPRSAFFYLKSVWSGCILEVHIYKSV